MAAQNHSERDHAKYPPSRAKRDINCHGSVAASEGFEDKRSRYAEEGTECHEAGANVLEGMGWDKATAFLSEEQEWIVSEYTNYAFDLIDRMISRYGKENVQVWIEQRVRSKRPGMENHHGTADLCILVKPIRTLAVIDLKAGYNPVSPGTPDAPNEQLASYGWLAMEHHDLWAVVDKVRLTIVQPRVYQRPETVIVTPNALHDHALRVQKAITAIEHGATSRHAGDWCFFCPAKGRCSTHRQLAVEKAKLIFSDGELQHARNYKPEELIEILNEAELIAAHIEGVRAHVMRELEKGRLKGQGWKLVPKRATAKWSDPEKLLEELSGVGAKHLAFKPKMLTPNQLAVVLKKEGADFDLTDYFVKESSGPTLAREEDPRDELDLSPFNKE